MSERHFLDCESFTRAVVNFGGDVDRFNLNVRWFGESVDGLRASMDEHTAALRENTEAMREHTAELRAQRPVTINVVAPAVGPKGTDAAPGGTTP